MTSKATARGQDAVAGADISTTGGPRGPLPRTRFQPPRGPARLLARPRLLHLLDGEDRAPVTVVTGLPGAGKTTLVSEWARMAPERVAWLTCDLSDRDPAQLWAALGAALGVDPPTTSIRSVTPADDGAPFDPGPLLDRLDVEDRPLTLVIDDAHLPGEALGSLRPLVDWLPDTARLVVLSRSQPALPVAELQLRGRLAEIRDRDLRLTFEETAAFLELFGLDERPETLAAIQDASEGWVASVSLTVTALRGARAEGQASHDIVGATPAPLTAFLRTELLERLGPDLRDFLLDTCVLDEVTREVAAALVGSEHAAAAFAVLEHAVLPVEVVSDDGAFRFHPQFQRVLRSIVAGHDPHRLDAKHAQAAAALEGIGRHREAIQHYLRAGEHEAAVSLVGCSALQGNFGEAQEAVAAWLAEADPDQVRSDPSGQSQVLAASGSIVNGALVSAHRWLDRAAAAPGPLSDRVRAQTAICRSALYLLEGDVAGVEEQFRTAEAVRDEWPVVWTLLHFLLAARARLWGGDAAGAATALAEVEHHPGLDGAAEAAVLSLRAELHLVNGELVPAVDQANAAVGAVGDGVGSANVALQDAYRVRGLARYEQGLFVGAEEDLLRAFEAAHPSRPAMAAIAMAGLGRVRAAQGQVDEALDQLAGARGWLPARSWLRDLFLATEGGIDLLAGDLERARHAASEISAADLRRLLSVRVALTEGDPDVAEAELDDAPPPVTRRQRVDLAILRARVEQLRDRDGAATTALQEAVAQAESQRLVRPFFEDGAQLAPLLVPVLGRRPRGAFITAMRRELDRIAHVDASPVPLDRGRVARLALLTRREREILERMAGDHTMRELAESLHISMNTIRTHAKSIYRKLGVSSRDEAARFLL